MNNLRKYQWCNAIFLVKFEFEVKKGDKKWILSNLFGFLIWSLKLLLDKYYCR